MARDSLAAPKFLIEVLGASGSSSGCDPLPAPGPIHEKCIGSLAFLQSPPQQKPESVHTFTNHFGMSVTSFPSAR